MIKFTSKLSRFQLGVLFDTVQSITDKKAVHIPSVTGESYTVPFTTDVLQQMIDMCSAHYADDQAVPFQIEIIPHENGTTTIDIRHDEKNARFTYTVQDDEFRAE